MRVDITDEEEWDKINKFIYSSMEATKKRLVMYDEMHKKPIGRHIVI